jgi:beta-N-acetylhexosaminidase
VQSLTVEEKITGFVQSLTVEEMVGQTLMVGFRDSKDRSFKNANAGLKKLIKDYKIGNVILYKDNFDLKLEDDREIRKSVFDITRSLQSTAFHSQEKKKKIPLFVAVDQEGGAKVRLDKGVTQVPDPMFIGATRAEQHAYDAGHIIGSEMKRLGFNMILAPVADIVSQGTVIGKRSFGSHEDIVAPLCVQFMKGIKEAGILAVGKHFPGHGDTEKDPHSDLPILRHKDLSQLRNTDMFPFERLIDNGVDAIMTAHLLAYPINEIDPVTISKKANKGILRKDLKFNGLIIADDFSVMKAILKVPNGPDRTREEATIAAYAAGNDIIIYGWIEEEEPVGPKKGISLEKFKVIYKEIIDHFEKKENQKELKERVKRIITAKTRIVKFEDFYDFSTWQASHYMEDEEYLKLKKKNEKISENIAKDSVVLITESGKPCNDITNSVFFRHGKGPLNNIPPLESRSDKVLLVSPVFVRDNLTDAVRYHGEIWLPREHIETIKLLWINYGWYEKEQVDDASASGHWGVPLKPLAKTNSDGKLEFDQPLIEEKVKEIEEKAKDKRLTVFGAAERDHIEVLKCLAPKLENTPILVLLFREPYLIPKDIYDKKNVSVVFLPSIPNMHLAADLLYGNIQPKDASYLPFSIPSLINRSKAKGASIIPCFVGKCAKEDNSSPVSGPISQPGILPIWWSLLSGLIGAVLFFVFPREKLKFSESYPSQYNRTDLFWTLIIGLAAAVIIYFLFPLLSKVSIVGIEFNFMAENNVFRYIITGVISFLSPGMWLRFIKAISS